MDRCGTRISVTLHKFAKVPWLKLRRDNSVMDSDLRIAAVNTEPMAIEEIDSDEERRTRLRRKKETLGMGDTVEVHQTRGSRDAVTHLVEKSIAQRTAPDLVLSRDEPGGLLEPAQEERKARGKSVPIVPNPAEKAARAHAHEFPQLVQLLRASQSRGRFTITLRARVPIIMADCCFMQDATGSELCTILDMLDVALGMMAAISVEEKGPATNVVSAVVEHLLAWAREKVIFRIDGEPAIRALGVAIQHARSEETVIERRPKFSLPSTGPVENMNEELCGLVTCFRTCLKKKWKMEITTESPLLPWLVRHCGWILNLHAVRADGRTGYSRLKEGVNTHLALLYSERR